MKKIQISILTLGLALFTTAAFAQIRVVSAPVSGYVKIGDTGVAPTEQLDVDGNIRATINATNYFNITNANNAVADLQKVTAAGGSIIDISPSPTDGTSNASFRFFRSTNTTGASSFVVHRGNGGSSWNTRMQGFGDSYLNVLTGNVGIGTTAPTQKLSVNGTAGKPGGGSWAAFSDQRLKKNVNTFEGGLEEILQINPVTYSYNGKAGIEDTNTEYVGIIAQEMQKIAPYTVNEVAYQELIEEGEDETYKSYRGTTENYLQYDGTAVTYMLVNAIKEQQEVIDALTDRIEKMESKITSTDVNSELTESVVLSDNNTLDGMLKQNQPNPFNGATEIGFVLPENTNSAYMLFTDISGKVIKKANLNLNSSKLTVEANELSSGIYNYSLIVNGELVATKKMVLSK